MAYIDNSASLDYNDLVNAVLSDALTLAARQPVKPSSVVVELTYKAVGEKVASQLHSVAVYVSVTAPATYVIGQVWLNSDNRRFYVSTVASPAAANWLLLADSQLVLNPAQALEVSASIAETGQNQVVIVNDLTTGGVSSALSAEQGKALKTSLSNLKTVGGQSLEGPGNIPFPADQTVVVNDLTTGGVSAALSAEQGKTLKQLVDNVSAGAPQGVVYVDTTGVTSTTGDIVPAILAAINLADNGPYVPPKRVVCPPGEWRVRTNLTVTDKSVDFDSTGALFVYDPAQVVGTTDFNVASTSGWPTSGTLTVQATNGLQTVSYTGVAASPTRFTGCTGWTGNGSIEQGSLVTNGTQTTTANLASNVVAGDAFFFKATLSSPVAVTAIGGATQTGPVPELYVNGTTAFASSGSLTVTKSDGTTAAVTYTGKTPYSFTGCTGITGIVLAGATVTDGSNTTQTIQSRYGYPSTTTTTVGSQAANSATLNVANTDNYPNTGAVRILSSSGTEVIAYTGKTLTSFTGCTGGSAGTISASAVVLYDGNTSAGTKESYGTRIYCNVAGISYGDVVKLFSDDILNPIAFNAAGSGTVEFQAEYGKVMVVNTVDSYIVIDRELYLNYLTNVRLCKLDSSRSLRVRSSHMRYVHKYPKVNVNLGGYKAHITIDGYVEPKTGTVGTAFFPGPNLSFSNCYMPQVDTVYGSHSIGDTSNNQVGYVLNMASSQGGGCRWLWGERTRHVFTTNATDVSRAGNSDARNYGGVTDFHVETLVGINNESFAWDTHTDAINVTGGRVVVRNDFQPRSEQMGAVQFRGYRLCGVDHIHYDGPGYALLVQGDIGAADFYVNKITGAHQYTYRGGAGTSERYSTTASGAQTLPSATFNVASAADLPTAGSALVHTTDNGPQTITWTGVTGNQLTGVTGGSGSVGSGAIVCRVVAPSARLRIASIDVQATGGTSLLRHTRDGLLDIGELRVRYVPGVFKPQAGLANNVVSFTTARDPDNSRLRIGKMHIDLSAYASAAAQPVSIYAIALDTSSATQNYKFNSADVDELTVDFGSGYGSGPGIKFGLINGTGQSKNGVTIGELKILQTGVAANAFNPSLYVAGTANQNVRLRGRIRGSAGSFQEIGDFSQSISSATQALYHSGASYFLATNTTAVLAPTLRSRITVTSGSAKVTSLQAPTFDGQVWRLSCAVGSANPLVIASGQISNVGADLNVPAGSEVVLTGSGGLWFKFTSV